MNFVRLLLSASGLLHFRTLLAMLASSTVPEMTQQLEKQEIELHVIIQDVRLGLSLAQKGLMAAWYNDEVSKWILCA